MDTEWLINYYRSLGWDEGRVTRFLKRAAQNEASKKKELDGNVFLSKMRRK